jgi:hypothetical protein
MHCEWALLCDTAYRRSGKTYIAGTYDTIKAEPIPGYRHPTAAVVARLVGNPAETASVKVEVCEPGGKPVAQGTAQATLGPQGTSEVVVPFPAIPIDNVGLYSIRVSIEGQTKKIVNLFVEELP